MKRDFFQTTFILGMLIFAGLLLRTLYFSNITFGYDQARDAFQSIDIIKNLNIKIIGPTTDIKGLFHGPLFWYLISPFYFFSKGSPLAVKFFLIILNIINICFIFYFSKFLFKNRTIAILSAIFFTVSFEAIQYARWISNPPPALLSIAFFFFGFYLGIQKKAAGFPIMFLSLALSINFQFFLVYQVLFLLFIFIYLYLTSKKDLLNTFKKHIYVYIAALFFYSPFLISELKFKFQGTKALFGFFIHSKNGGEQIYPKLLKFFPSLIKNISFNFTGGNIPIAQILFVLLIIYVVVSIFKKHRFLKEILFLFIWVISPIIIYPVEKNNSYFLNIGNIYPLILLGALSLYEISIFIKKASSFFIFFCAFAIFLLNLHLIVVNNKNGEILFSVQHRQVLDDETKVLDYIYANGEKYFGINTITNPLFINTTWAYIFDWYGKSKYGYMPAWLGYPLDDAGKDVKFSNLEKKEGKTLFLIIEPGPGTPDEYIKGYKEFENTRSDMVEEKHIGNFIVEKRTLKSEKHFSREEVFRFAIQR